MPHPTVEEAAAMISIPSPQPTLAPNDNPRPTNDADRHPLRAGVTLMTLQRWHESCSQSQRHPGGASERSTPGTDAETQGLPR